jgi:hypothetical protein
MNQQFKNTKEEINTYIKLEELNDRELQELIACNLLEIKRKNISIKNNVQFFYYFFISILIIAFIFLNK